MSHGLVEDIPMISFFFFQSHLATVSRCLLRGGGNINFIALFWSNEGWGVIVLVVCVGSRAIKKAP